MGQTCKTEIIWILWLFAIGILLHIKKSHAVCVDGSFNSPCICLDDVQCDGGDVVFDSKQDCLCTNGTEGTLDSIARECMKKNGRIRALYISGTNITSLKPLFGALEIVEHQLVVCNTRIESLEPIKSLQNVGSLAIVGNGRLPDIGLENVLKVDGDLVVFRNEKLSDIGGFDRMTYVGGSLCISSNDVLSNISGFNELTEVDGHLSIRANSRLVNITNLDKLTHVGGSLTIDLTKTLPDIIGLSELAKVDGDVNIISNVGLVKISGLKSLMQVGGQLHIEDNPKLIGLDNNLKMIGGLIICANEDLSSLYWLQNLMSIDGDVNICENPRLQTLRGIQNILGYVNGSLAIVNNKIFNPKSLKSVTHVNGNMTIQYRKTPFIKRLLGGVLDNVIAVDGDLKLIGLDIRTSAFQKLESVGHDLLISDSTFEFESQVMPSLHSVERHVTLSKTHVGNSEHFQNLRHIGGDLIIEGNNFHYSPSWSATTFTLLSHVQTVGGGLDVNANEFDKSFEDFDILPNLESLCSASTIGTCGLEIRSNDGYGFIRGFMNVCAFNGFVAIVGNIGLYSVTGFPKTMSLMFTIVHAEEEVVSGGTLGALIVAFNPDLRSIDGFQSLVGLEGNLFIFQNPQLDHLVLENLTHVNGLTQIVQNGGALKNIIFTEPLPYTEPGCRSRHNTIPSFELSNGSIFLTALQYDECSVETLIPMIVGIATIVAIIVVSYLLFRYIFLSQTPSVASTRCITRRDLRNMFGVHVLALADVLSDVGFVVTVFIVWEGQGPGEKDVRVLVIGILSTIAVVGSQIYMAISVYMGLFHKLPESNEPLIENLRGNGAMRRRDWLLLFPGLLVLDAEVIKHLPWGQSIQTSDLTTDGFPHKYFARVASVAVALEDVPQIILQIAFTVVIEGSDGWAITGAIASLTLSVSDLIVKLAFPLMMKARILYNPIMEPSPDV